MNYKEDKEKDFDESIEENEKVRTFDILKTSEFFNISCFFHSFFQMMTKFDHEQILQGLNELFSYIRNNPKIIQDLVPQIPHYFVSIIFSIFDPFPEKELDPSVKFLKNKANLFKPFLICTQLFTSTLLFQKLMEQYHFYDFLSLSLQNPDITTIKYILYNYANIAGMSNMSSRNLLSLPLIGSVSKIFSQDLPPKEKEELMSCWLNCLLLRIKLCKKIGEINDPTIFSFIWSLIEPHLTNNGIIKTNEAFLFIFLEILLHLFTCNNINANQCQEKKLQTFLIQYFNSPNCYIREYSVYLVAYIIRNNFEKSEFTLQEYLENITHDFILKEELFRALLYVAQTLLYQIDDISPYITLFSNILSLNDEMSFNEKTSLYQFFNILINQFDIDSYRLNESGILDFLLKSVDVISDLDNENQLYALDTIYLLKTIYQNNPMMDALFKAKLEEFDVVTILRDFLDSNTNDTIATKVESILIIIQKID